MTFQQILEDIQAGKIAPIYYLHGEEGFLIDKILDALEQEGLLTTMRLT